MYCARALADLLLPRTCIVCGRSLDVPEAHICIECRAQLPQTFYWLREHNPMADRLNERLQSLLEQAETFEPEAYARAAALFFYHSDSPYSGITKALKYGGNMAAGRRFSRLLGECLASSELFSDVDLVVPVPLHFLRHWRRGYNQAAVIAEEVAACLPSSPVLSQRLLRRRRHTRSQTRLSIEEKGRNVSAAFALNYREAARLQERFFSAPSSGQEGCGESGPQHILLLDDVFTTGSTLSECLWTLRRHYGTSVRISVATLACVGE